MSDGADVPASQTAPGPATDVVSVGQTADFLWEPGPGTHRLTLTHPRLGLLMERRLVVRRR